MYGKLRNAWWKLLGPIYKTEKGYSKLCNLAWLKLISHSRNCRSDWANITTKIKYIGSSLGFMGRVQPKKLC